MKELYNALSSVLRTYPYEAAVSARAPYAVYESEESPIRTLSGIAGYEGTCTISVYGFSIANLEALVNRIIALLDGQVFDGRKYYYDSASSGEAADAGLVFKNLIFNTLT